MRRVAERGLVPIAMLAILAQLSRYVVAGFSLRPELRALQSAADDHAMIWRRADLALTAVLGLCVVMAPTVPWSASRRRRVALGLAMAAAGIASCRVVHWTTHTTALVSWSVVAVGLRALVHRRVPRVTALAAGVVGLLAAPPPVAVWLPGSEPGMLCMWPGSLLTEALNILPGLAAFALMMGPASNGTQRTPHADRWLQRMCTLVVVLFVADTLLEHGIVRLVAGPSNQRLNDVFRTALLASAADWSAAHVLALAGTLLAGLMVLAFGQRTFALLGQVTRGLRLGSHRGQRPPACSTGVTFALTGCVVAASLLGRNAFAYSRQEHGAAWALRERSAVMARLRTTPARLADGPRGRVLWMESDGSLRDADDGGPPVQPVALHYGGVLMPESATAAEFAALARSVCEGECQLEWVVPMDASNALGEALPSRFAIARPLRRQLVTTAVSAHRLADPPGPQWSFMRRDATPVGRMDAVLSGTPNTRLVDVDRSAGLTYVVPGPHPPASAALPRHHFGADTAALVQHRLSLVLGAVSLGFGAWLVWLIGVIVVTARRYALCTEGGPLDQASDTAPPCFPGWVPRGPAHRPELTSGASPYRRSATAWVGSPSSVLWCALDRVAPALVALGLFLLPSLVVGAVVTWMLSAP
ncbi:MAG: hypothetical protein R3B40_14420 [Polyangiales bacterium]